MDIHMSCPACGQVLTAPETAVGKRARCPGCGQIMLVPMTVPADEFAFASAAMPSAGSDAWADGPPAAQEAEPAPDSQGEVLRPCPVCREPIVAAAAECGSCGVILDPRLRAQMRYRSPVVGAAARGKKIRRYYNYWLINVVFGIGLTLSFVGAFLGHPMLVVCPLFGLPMILIGVIFYYMLLYQLWSTVQDGRAAATPGGAVGLLFVPFFCFYWQFTAFWGLAKELNRVSRENGIAAPRANEQLALTACILHCCAIIPYLRLVPLMRLLPEAAAMILSVAEMKNMCRVATAINEGFCARGG